VGNGVITVSGFFDNDGDTTVGNNGLLDVNDAFTTRTGGSLQLNDGTFRVAGNFTSNGSFSTNQGLVDFDGDSPQSLVGDFSGGGFFDVQVGTNAEVNPANASTIDDSRSILVNGNMTIEGQYGSGSSEEADLTFQGDDFNANGDFFADEIRFNNGGTSKAEGTVFSKVTVTSNTKLTLDASFEINGTLNIESDEVEVTASPLTLNGDVTIGKNGELDPLTSAIVMSGMGDPTANGNGVQDVTGDAVQNFGNLTVRDVSSDDNNTPDTKVKFSGSGNQLDVNQFTINEASVTSNRPVFIEGNFTAQNNGTFSFGSNPTQELVRFDGSTQQQLDSPTDFTFNVVEIANGGATAPEVEIKSGSKLSITERLILTQGELGTNSGLTFPSGSVIQYNGGSISGDVTAERELTGTSANWYAVSPATKNTSLKSFEESGPDDIFTSGNPSADNTQANTGSVTWYDETVSGTKDQGYQYPDLTTSFGPDTGTFFYIYDGIRDNLPVTLGAVGEPRTSSSFTSFSLSFTSSEGTSEDGWNLVNNPYLAVVDWDDFNATSLSCVDNTVYIHEPGTGDDNTYSALSYTAGAGSDTGSLFEQYGYIAPFQSIWVKTSSSSCNLSSFGISDITTAQVTPSDRNNDGATSDDPFQKDGSSTGEVGLLQLSMEKDTLRSKTLLAFRDGGTRSKDEWDAYEVQFQGAIDKTLPRIQLHSVLENGKALQTSTLPAQFEEETSFPIETYAKGCESGSPYAGEATLRWPTVRNLPADWGIVLEDTKTGETIDLRTNSEYSFTLEGSTSSSTCASSKSVNSGTTSRGENPPPPSPNVVEHSVSKDGEPSTRFQLTIKPGAIAPVELSSFTAEASEQGALLSWTTARARNLKAFHVQRKAEDGSFTTLENAIVKVTSNDGSSETSTYEYGVEGLDAGTHTFRLKQVTSEGTTYSDPVDVKIGLDGAYQLSTYPNPVRTQATVEFAIKESADVTLALYNTLGQKVRTVYRGTPPAEETKRVPVETQNLSSGVYFLRLEGEGVTGTQRMTVVK
jgi:hypothetical protein